MSQGKYSPTVRFLNKKNFDFNCNCYGEPPLEWNKDLENQGVLYDPKSMFADYDSQGFDSYGYSCFDRNGNYTGVGTGIDRMGYTENEYLQMTQEDFESFCANLDPRLFREDFLKFNKVQEMPMVTIFFDGDQGQVVPDSQCLNWMKAKIEESLNSTQVEKQIQVGSESLILALRVLVKKGCVNPRLLQIKTAQGFHSYIGPNGEIEDESIYKEIRFFDDSLSELIL